jgi:hypothetical protein
MRFLRWSSLGWWLVAVAVGLTGCGGGKSEEVAIRVAALTYAFEHDTEWQAEPGKWVFSVEAGAETEVVIAALAKYPISRETLKTEDRGSMARVDVSSGKRYAHWSVEVRPAVSGGMWIEVGCVKGGLNGHGQALEMKKKWGRWTVVSSSRTWIS